MNAIVTMVGGLVVSGSLAGCTFSPADVDEAADSETTTEGLHEALTAKGLSKKEETIALKAIDDLCGDTWCAGDFNFRFDRLKCQPGCREHAGSCTLTFRVFSYETDVKTGPTYERQCRTQGFEGFGSIVKPQGSYYSLDPDYYLALTDCVGQIASSLPR